ncbi:MAG: ABC transporter [Planctomycetota bacterium]|nr:MAG: ABC transporter [Planctomycetota bacterium]
MNVAPLQTTGLGKRYGDTVALRDLELRVEPGEVLGFLGPNGAGKTTTLRLCLDLLRPSTGKVELFGQPPSAATARARVGYLPGELVLDERLSADAQLTLLDGLRTRATPPCDPRRRDELCERLGLSTRDRAKRQRELSRGNKQKVGLVAAFQHDPELLVLDEPSTALDPLVRDALFELLVETGQRGRSVIHSSHVLTEIERTSTRVLVLRGGVRVPVKDLSELRASLPRRMRVRFQGEVPRAALERAGAEILRLDGGQVELRLAGAPDRILAVLHAERVLDFAYPEADLDAAFAALYAEERAS